MNFTPLIRSKTLWTNAAIIGVWILELILQAATAGTIPPMVSPYLLPLVPFINVALRFVTTRPLDLNSLRELLELFRRPPLPPAATALVFLALVATVSAAPPTANIGGADPGISGEILELVADGDGEPTHFSWDVTPRITGRRQLTQFDGGKRAIVATFPGVYLVTLTVSNADGNNTARRQIVIPGATPTPTPEPQPVPPAPPSPPAPVPPPLPSPPIPTPPAPPTPTAPAPLPIGRFGMAQAKADVVRTVVSPNRKAEAKCLADACEVIHSSIGAQTLGVPQATVNAMGEALDRCTPAAWDDARGRLTARIKQLYDARQLNTRDDWQALISEMRTGLLSVQ